jgi:hypothetical protein
MRMVLVVSLLFSAAALAGTANAQHRLGHHHHGRGPHRVFIYPRTFYPRTWFWYNRPFYYYPTHVTESQGYRDGLHDGRDDAQDNERYNPYKHNSYKDAQSSAYVEGFLRGYAEGYRDVG